MWLKIMPAAIVLSGFCVLPALALELSDNPEVRSRQLSNILDQSIEQSKDGSDTLLGKAPCNVARHRAVFDLFTKADVPVTGIQWGWTMATWGRKDGQDYNFALDCEKGMRTMTLRPISEGVALDPKMIDLMAQILATDEKQSFKVMRPAVEKCLREGVNYEKHGLAFFCHSPSANNSTDKDFRLFVTSSSVRDFDK